LLKQNPTHTTNNGRAEVAKLMLAYAKEPFEVIDHSYEEQKNNLDDYPFGQCPRCAVCLAFVCVPLLQRHCNRLHTTL
jgi:hypothetical protein